MIKGRVYDQSGRTILEIKDGPDTYTLFVQLLDEGKMYNFYGVVEGQEPLLLNGLQVDLVISTKENVVITFAEDVEPNEVDEIEQGW